MTMIPTVENRRTHGLSNVPSEETLPIKQYGLAVPIFMDERGNVTQMLEKCYDCGVESDCVLEPRQVSGGDGVTYESDFAKVPVCDSRRACHRNMAAKKDDENKAKQAEADSADRFRLPLSTWIERGWATTVAFSFLEAPKNISFQDALLQGYTRLTPSGLEFVKHGC